MGRIARPSGASTPLSSRSSITRSAHRQGWVGNQSVVKEKVRVPQSHGLRLVLPAPPELPQSINQTAQHSTAQRSAPPTCVTQLRQLSGNARLALRLLPRPRLAPLLPLALLLLWREGGRVEQGRSWQQARQAAQASRPASQDESRRVGKRSRRSSPAHLAAAARLLAVLCQVHRVERVSHRHCLGRGALLAAIQSRQLSSVPA